MNSKFIHKAVIKVKSLILGAFPKTSYSRSGEDLLIDELINYKLKGCYVDVGAFHPMTYSNTFKFYLRGWTGINIEPNSGAIALFNKIRPRDLNLNLAVSDTEDTYDYYMNDADPTMNTISKKFADQSAVTYGLRLSEKRQIKGRRLEQIILESKIDIKNIDFFNIDVEGHDFEVIKSNNWENIRPRLVLVELNCNIEQISQNEIYHYLKSKNYILISYTYLNGSVGNAFFKNNDSE